MARLNDEDKDKIIKLYNTETTNGKEIARLIDKPYHSVFRFMKKMDLKLKNEKLTDEDISLIIKLYNDGLTINEIHKLHFVNKCSSGSVNNVLRREGITRKNGNKSKLDNHDFFETIDTEEKAYWLGFLYADGNVRKNTNKGESYSIRLELKVQDKYMLEKFAKTIQLNKEVKEHKEEKPRFEGYDTLKHNAYIAFNSTKMFNDLCKHGCVPNKTLKLKELPNLSRELMKHFIRGYFDGDGTVYLSSHSKTLRVGFYGTYNFVENILIFLNEEIGTPLTKVTTRKNANVSLMAISKISAVNDFYNYIYDDATIFLNRKKEKFEMHENKYKTA